MDWDLNGNLWKRQDLKLSPNVTEEFFYDALNRFDKSERTPLGGSTETNADVTLDAIGNITWKQGVGSYTYHATQKRAVVSAGSFSFDYDANGNMTSRNGSSISYTSYNLPSVINAGTGTSSTLSYGAFRNRYKQIAVTPATGTETTIYVAGLLEKVTRGSSIEYRHLIHGGNGAAAIHTRVVGGASSTYYLHRDHLGSPELITDSSGNEVVRPSFGAYGERRDGTDWSGPPSTADLTDIANTIRRGFTGHEHMDAVGLIHMNGRVYEPVAGRFLGVDPIVQVGNSQSPNSYSYVWNNPLTLIDPSGFEADDVVTEGDSQPQFFPQCPYQIANIAVDCPFRYGWRWDIDPFDRWLMDEYRIEMWVRSRDALAETIDVTSSPTTFDAFPVFDNWARPAPSGYLGVIYGTAEEAVLAAARYILDPTRNDQYAQRTDGEFKTRVDVVNGGFAFAAVDYYPCPSSHKCRSSTKVDPTVTRYIIHSHPTEGYEPGPSKGPGDDFDSLGDYNAANRTNIYGIVIRPDGTLVQYRQVVLYGMGSRRPKRFNYKRIF